MNKTGKLLSETPVSGVANQEPKQETKVLKVYQLSTQRNHFFTFAVLGRKCLFFPFLFFDIYDKRIQSFTY